MKQQEAVARRVGDTVTRVQTGDSVARRLQQFRVVRQPTARGAVREIGKKTVEDIVVAVAEKADFQFLDFRPYRFAAGQHHRNHHQRGVRGGMPVRKSSLGSGSAGSSEIDQRVDDLNRQFAQREYRERRSGRRGSRSDSTPASLARSQESTVKQAVNPMMPPRYTGVAWREAARRMRVPTGMRALVSASSCARPLESK